MVQAEEKKKVMLLPEKVERKVGVRVRSNSRSKRASVGEPEVVSCGLRFIFFRLVTLVIERDF